MEAAGHRVETRMKRTRAKGSGAGRGIASSGRAARWWALVDGAGAGRAACRLRTLRRGRASIDA